MKVKKVTYLILLRSFVRLKNHLFNQFTHGLNANMNSRSFKSNHLFLKLINSLLCFQLGFGSLFIQLGHADQTFQRADYLDEFHRAQQELEKELTRAEASGDFSASRSALYFYGEFLELFSPQGELIKKVDLAEPDIEREKLVYDHLKINVDAEGRLMFEAIRSGTLIARHTIYQVDDKTRFAKVAFDKEKLVVLDTAGSLHATDMTILRQAVLFRAKAPFAKKVWKTERVETLGNLDSLEMRFRTPGLKPFPEENPEHPNHAQYYAPKYQVEGSDREPLLSNDLTLSRRDEQGNRSLLAVFDGSTIRENILRLYLHIFDVGVIVSPQEMPPELLTKLVKGISSVGLPNQALPQIDQQHIGMSFSNEEFRRFLARAQGLIRTLDSYVPPQDKNQRENVNHPYKRSGAALVDDRTVIVPNDASYDIQTYESALNTYSSLAERARVAVDKGQLNSQEVTLEDSKKLLQALNENDLSQYWEKLAKSSVPSENVEIDQPQDNGGEVKKKARWLPSTKTFIILGAMAAGTLSAAAGYHYEVQPVVETLHWMHEHLVPRVLMVEGYRSAVILSTLSLIAIWPAVELISAVTPLLFKRLGELTLKSKNIKVGSKLYRMGHWCKEKGRVWSELNRWQRIVTIGMRAYAPLMYYFYHWFFDEVLRQPNFLLALRKRLNPFRNGIGFNRPTRASIEKGRERMSKALLTKQELNVIARQYALVLVSQETNIDPATLLSLITRKITFKDLNSLTRVQQKEWSKIATRLSEWMQNLDKNTLKQLLEVGDADAFLSAFAQAKRIASELKNETKFAEVLRDLRLRFQSLSGSLLAKIANLGRFETNILEKGFSTPDIGDQVKQEYVTDHVIVVGYPALLAPERTNFNRPQELAANSNGALWTNPGHLFDVAMNTIIHFLVSGSRMMMVYYSEPPLNETQYQPYENLEIKIAENRESLSQGVKRWVGGLLNPEKSPLQEKALRSFKASFITLQGFFLMTVFFRLAFNSDADASFMQSLEMAFRSALRLFFAKDLYIGIWWWIIQTGNLMYNGTIEFEGEAYKRKLIEYRNALKFASKPLLEKTREEILELYAKSSMSNEINKLREMNSEEFFRFAKDYPPIVTKGAKGLTWFMTLIAVLGSTWKGTTLFVESLRPEELTNEQLIKWGFIWLGFPIAFAAATHRKTLTFFANLWAPRDCKQVLEPPQES